MRAGLVQIHDRTRRKVKTSIDCLPCVVKQTLESVHHCRLTPEAQVSAVRELLLAATALDYSKPPPLLVGQLQAQLREIAGCDDPYVEIKQRFTRLAEKLFPPLAESVRRSADPFAAAVRLAIAANVIDLGAKSGLTEEEVSAAAASALERPVVGELEALRAAAASVKRILYLADNAGEVLFDKLLIQQLPRGSVTVAVRGRPVLNDATLADAKAVGLEAVAEIISNGSCAPGTVLEDCTPEFRRRFKLADLIIAKGQGNFETLHTRPAPLYCLFRVRCPTAAARCGFPEGTHVVWKNKHPVVA